MKKMVLIMIMVFIMILAGCSASDNNTPDENISATEQPEARTTGLLPEGEICNITAKTLPEGLEYTFSDSTSIQNIREYFDSLTLESDFPENPETYNGMTWVLKFTFSDQSEETIYHFGNMFVKNEKSQWFKMKYKEAEKLDGILADIEIFQISPSDNKVGEFLDKIGEVTSKDDIDNNYDAMMEAYTGIAQKYFDVQAAIIENGIDYYTENLEEGLNRLYFGAPGTVYAEDKQTILLYDINNDGILEFFIARLHHGESKNTVYAGYTWKDGELCQLMPGVEIGYRSGTIDIRADGKVLSFFSGSAWDYGVEVYSLPKNGTDLIREGKVYASRVDGDGYGNSFSRYYKKTEGQDPVEISEVEYEQFISGFKEIPLNFIDNTPEVLEALRKK